MINFAKSEILFSGTVDEDLRVAICQELGVVEVAKHSKYLGLPVVIGQNKKATFKEIEEKVSKKIQSWRYRFLSAAGREVLIKSALQAMPIFSMQCYRFPKSLNNNLMKSAINFFWKGNESPGGIHWISKERLCLSKLEGGIGLKDLETLNDALLMKQLWRLEVQPELLMAQVLKGKYFPQSSLLEARLGTNPSHVWRNLLKLKDVFSQGLEWEGVGSAPKWLSSPSGEYTTKAGYEFLMIKAKERNYVGGECSDPRPIKLFWKKIWRANIPPKIRMIAWRFFHNSLPDLANLRKRGCYSEGSCVFCGFKPESILHLVRDCWRGKEAGLRLGIDTRIFDRTDHAPADWIYWCSGGLKGIDFEKLLYLIWALWFSRNDLIHNDRLWSIDDLVIKFESMKRLADRNWVSNVMEDIMDQEIVFFTDDIVRISCDGSWNGRSRIAGWAIVVVKERWVSNVMADWKGGVCSSVDAEGLALLMGMKEAARLLLTKVFLLSDCAAVIWLIFSGGAGGTLHLSWLPDCLRLMEENPGWKIKLIRREQIALADALCKKARCLQWSWNNAFAVPFISPSVDLTF